MIVHVTAEQLLHHLLLLEHLDTASLRIDAKHAKTAHVQATLRAAGLADAADAPAGESLVFDVTKAGRERCRHCGGDGWEPGPTTGHHAPSAVQ